MDLESLVSIVANPMLAAMPALFVLLNATESDERFVLQFTSHEIPDTPPLPHNPQSLLHFSKTPYPLQKLQNLLLN